MWVCRDSFIMQFYCFLCNRYHDYSLHVAPYSFSICIGLCRVTDEIYTSNLTRQISREGSTKVNIYAKALQTLKADFSGKKVMQRCTIKKCKCRVKGTCMRSFLGGELRSTMDWILRRAIIERKILRTTKRHLYIMHRQSLWYLIEKMQARKDLKNVLTVNLCYQISLLSTRYLPFFCL